MKQRPESFVRGALILTVSGIVVKILGALYNPIIVRIFAQFDGHRGNLGKALVGIPAVTYLIILGFSSSGFNIAVSRLVAARFAGGDSGGAVRAYRWSLQLMAGLGLVSAVALYLLAPQLAAAGGSPEAVRGYQAIAPAVFLVAIVSAYRGLFSGMQEQTPYGISLIVEQAVKGLTAIALVAVLAGRDVPLAAAGANFGSTLGGLAAVLYLAWLWRSRSAGSPLPEPVRPETRWQFTRELIAVAVPISLIGLYMPIIMAADNTMVLNRLLAGSVTHDLALDFVGRIQNAFSVTGLPLLLSVGLTVSLVPALTAALIHGDRAGAAGQVGTAYRLTLAVALPSAVGLFLLASPVYALIYPSTLGGETLQAMALALPFMMLAQTTAGVLQGIGQEWRAVRNLLLGVAVKIALTYWWVRVAPGGDPVLAVRAACYATAVGLAAAGLLNLWDVRRRFGAGLALLDVVRTLAAALVMGLVVAAGKPLAGRLLHSTRLAALLLMVVAMVIYGVVLIAAGGLSAADLERVPRLGRRAAALLRRLHLLRG